MCSVGPGLLITELGLRKVCVPSRHMPDSRRERPTHTVRCSAAVLFTGRLMARRQTIEPSPIEDGERAFKDPEPVTARGMV